MRTPTVQELQESYDPTPAQARFVHELPACGFNASEAARRAGYSEKTAGAIGHENLKKPKIQAALAAVCRPLTQKAEITAERVLEELRRIAFASSTDVLQWDDSEVRVKPSDVLSSEAAAAVRSIEVSEREQPDGTSRRRVKVTMHSKERALDKLGRYFGLWRDPMEVQSEILRVFERMSSQQLKRLEQMDDRELMELVDKNGIYRLPAVVHGR